MKEYGENPDPKVERIQIGLANKLFAQEEINYWMERNEQRANEKTAKKRTLPTILYKEFYDEVNKISFNKNFSADWGEKTELLTKYFSGTRIVKNLNNFIKEKNYVKIGALFNKLVNYSQKRVQQ